jgi:ATP-binding cassette subfamily F protein uup
LKKKEKQLTAEKNTENIAAAEAETLKNKIKKKSFKEKFEFEQLQHVIATLETEKLQLSEQLSSGAGTHAEIAKWSERIGQIVEELNEKELRWLMLSELPD